MAQYKDTPFYTMDEAPELVKLCLVANDVDTGEHTVVMQMAIPCEQADKLISMEHLIAILQLKSKEGETPGEFGDIKMVRHPNDSQWVAHYCHANGMLLKFYLENETNMDDIVAGMEAKNAVNHSRSNVEVGTEEWFNSLFPTK